MSSSTSLLIGAGVIAAVSIPMILRIVPPNPIYGFRTRATLSNRELWYRANAFAGWALLIAAAASAALVFASDVFPSDVPGVAALAVPVAIAVIASLVYLRRNTGPLE